VLKSFYLANFNTLKGNTLKGYFPKLPSYKRFTFSSKESIYSIDGF
jgi:hypothetical protein